MTRKFALVISFSLLAMLSSCATMLNRDYENIEIAHDTNISRVWVNGEEVQGEEFRVRRSPNSLRIAAEMANGTDTLELDARFSSHYWGNIVTNYGIGMLIDAGGIRRWTYPSTTYLRVKEGKLEEWRYPPRPSGQIDIHFALPHANFFNVDRDSVRATAGFWGLELGVAYYLAENINVVLLGGVATDFFVPMPAAVTPPDEWEATSASYIDMRMHRLFDWFDIGAGVSISKINWRMKGAAVTREWEGSKTLLGLSLSTSYRFGDNGKIGLLYKPYLMQVNRPVQFDYAHHISIAYALGLSL